MKRNLIVTSAIVAVALSVAAAPAFAQGRGAQARQRDASRSTPSVSAPRSDGARQQSGRQAVARGTERRQGAGVQSTQPRSTARQPSAVQTVPRSSTSRQNAGVQSAPRGDEGRRTAAPRAVPRGNEGRQYSGAQAGSRVNPGASSQGYRSDDRRVYDQRRSGAYDARGYASHNRIARYDGRRYARPRTFVPYRPYYFSRSYYSFRPRLNIGFGLWLGYSVRYPWSWYYGGYAPRVYGYGYVPGQVYYADRGPEYYGGLSFDIKPSDADLYIDGEYVGEVGQFSPYGEPLTLVPGVHRIAIVRDGYMTLEWDVEVEAGMVLPYHGVMEPW